MSFPSIRITLNNEARHAVIRALILAAADPATEREYFVYRDVLNRLGVPILTDPRDGRQP